METGLEQLERNAMNDMSLNELERDVESARARLSKDLSVLRSPATMSDFGEDLKQEALNVKDRLIDKVQSSARSTALDWVEEMKARAAANPAATLVIGAGLAWRLLRHPPIATVLVGAGLFSLLRTAPARSAGQGDVDYLAEAKKNLRDQASHLVDEVKERSSAVAADMTEKASELGLAAKDKAQEFAAVTRDKVQQVTGFGGHGTALPDFDAARLSQTAQTIDPTGDQDLKNKMLLGAAGVAVALALGLSYRRRLDDNRD